MSRVIALLLFFVAMSSTADCQAQRARLFQRGSSPVFAPAPANSQTLYSQQSQLNYVQPQFALPQSAQVQRALPGHNKFEISRYSNYRNPFVSRLLDGPTTPGRRNPYEVESRYIGGFHQSHFSNIGIPSGDIGIRGNAYRWNTW